MDEAAATRRAAYDAVADVEPADLHARLESQLEAGSMVPGVLTIFTARASRDVTDVTDETVPEPVARRAAGVQLIYDGLRLTRSITHEEPWVEGNRQEGDLGILVADVLVARGFYLLARTEAAQEAVKVVRSFGSDQTVRRTTGDSSLDANLERDVLELAVVSGATFGERGVTPGLREFATGLEAGGLDERGFPAPAEFFPSNVHDRLATMLTDTTGSEGVTTSVDD